MDYNAIVKERNVTCIMLKLPILLTVRTKLVPSYEDDTASAQVNALELIQDPNQSSEEPKASSAQEGKPGSI